HSERLGTRRFQQRRRRRAGAGRVRAPQTGDCSCGVSVPPRAPGPVPVHARAGSGSIGTAAPRATAEVRGAEVTRGHRAAVAVRAPWAPRVDRPTPENTG